MMNSGVGSTGVEDVSVYVIGRFTRGMKMGTLRREGVKIEIRLQRKLLDM